jgi:NADH-quinone oxidoreductase subunit J
MDVIGFKGIIFILAAFTAIVSALLMVTRRNPIHSALWMILTFISMAVIYLLLNAQFIAVAQVMVYAGAIMMLILFVIMMVEMEKAEAGQPGEEPRSRKKKIAGALLGVILFLEVFFGVTFYRMTGKLGSYPVETVNNIGNAKTVGALLYGQYLFPSEIASILLLVGIVGAVVITKRNK